uniref:(northern house mosquito) hypothetical protein n=1 Tax=Culex pipiens TaxID=7175 RepID=A0A8D8ARK2_CULPI
MSSAVPAAAPDVRTYWRRLYWCIDRGGDDFAVLKSRPDLRSWCTFASEISDFGGVLAGEGAKVWEIYVSTVNSEEKCSKASSGLTLGDLPNLRRFVVHNKESQSMGFKNRTRRRWP